MAEGKAALLKSAQPCTQISEGGEFRGRVRDDAIREVSKKKDSQKSEVKAGIVVPWIIFYSIATVISIAAVYVHNQVYGPLFELCCRASMHKHL